MFLIILLFYKLYIAIINHKQVLCLARKNDSLMILQYSYILIIIFIIKGRWCKKENWWWTWTAHNGISKSSFTNSHFFFLSFASQWFVFSPAPPPLPPSPDSGYAAQCTAPRSQSQFRPRSLDSRPFKKNKKITCTSSPCLPPLPNAVLCSAKWSQILVGWQHCLAAVQYC